MKFAYLLNKLPDEYNFSKLFLEDLKIIKNEILNRNQYNHF